MAVNMLVRGGRSQGRLAGVTLQNAPRSVTVSRTTLKVRGNGRLFTSSIPKTEHAISRDLRTTISTKFLKMAPSVAQTSPAGSPTRQYATSALKTGSRDDYNGAVDGTPNIATPNGAQNGHTNGHQIVDGESYVDEYGAIVVGGGPAGLAVVGRLLDEGVKPVCWVDEKFEGGRLSARYREVPSNTKVKLFIAFARATSAFREIVDSEKSKNDPLNPYNTLMGMDQEKGCQINAAADLCLQLTLGLARHPDVVLKFGKATHLTNSADAKKWEVEITPADPERGSVEGRAPLVVLATGSKPLDAQLPKKFPNLSPLDLDLALTPSLLAHYLPSDKEETIALVGASHSAILVLRNLYELSQTSHPKLRVKWFSRHPLRYAEDRGDWILRDNTGLKGETAIWARANLEGEGWENGDVRKVVEKIFTRPGREEEDAFEDHLVDERVGRVCEAIGFERLPTPSMKLTKVGEDGMEWSRDVGNLIGDGLTGRIQEAGKQGPIDLPGLRGAGIAWPERVTDPEGNVESAVGLWKFMKYLTRVVPSWVEDAKAVEASKAIDEKRQ